MTGGAQSSAGHATKGLAAWAALAIALVGLAGLAEINRPAAGLAQVIMPGTGVGHAAVAEHASRTTDVSTLDANASADHPVTVHWRGAWLVAADGMYQLSAETDAALVWTLDGHAALQARAGSFARVSRLVALGQGYHPLEVVATVVEPGMRLNLSAGRADGVQVPLDQLNLVVALPRYPRLAATAAKATGTLVVIDAVGLAAGLWLLIVASVGLDLRRSARAPGQATVPDMAALARMALLALVIVGAAALRLDALGSEYGPVDRPAWAAQLVTVAESAVKRAAPTGVQWAPVAAAPHRDGPPSRYISDPYTYLEFARAMRSFYAAHYREPLFPFVTKVFLRLLGGQDVAVSFASAAFSVLTVAGVYLLGALAFSPWVGLGAAALLAVECDVISWGVGGWRDDAFACAFVFSAWALLRLARNRRPQNALIFGVIAGLACLVRITAVSFLLPGLIWLVARTGRPWSQALRQAALAATVAAVVAGPYIVNCWRVYGDPLYAIDYHTDNYLTVEGRVGQLPPTVAAYVSDKIRHQPLRTFETMALGVTAYPFTNKWTGFDPWNPHAGAVLAGLALAGLGLFLFLPSGRFLLLLVVSASIPFALTWRLTGDWRFTEYAYPIYLLAAPFAVWQFLHLSSPAGLTGLVGALRAPGRVVTTLATGLAIATAVWVAAVEVPAWACGEALRGGEEVTVTSGDNDPAFFGSGWWPGTLTNGTVTIRVAHGETAIVWLPLPSGTDCDLTLRLDPFPTPLNEETAPVSLGIEVNGARLTDLAVRSTPGLFGSYAVHVPGSLVRAPSTRLALRRNPSLDTRSSEDGESAVQGGATVALWYIRVHPRRP